MTAARPGPVAGKRPSASAWFALTLCATLLVSASVVGLYVVQDRALTAATAIVRDLRQARIDLYQGFVHATLGGAPGSPWDRDRAWCCWSRAGGPAAGPAYAGQPRRPPAAA